MAPKNAPALRRATMLAETYAECAVLVESLNSPAKLLEVSGASFYFAAVS